METLPSPSRKRAAVLQAIGGYINTGLSIVQGLLLLPLYLKYIGVETYGFWLASGGILSMLGLMNFGISGLIIQKVASAYAATDRRRIEAYFTSGFVIYIAISVLFGLIGLLVSQYLSSILKLNNDVDFFIKCFQFSVLAMMGSIINESLRSFSQALLRPIAPMFAMVVGRILGIAVTIYMLLHNYGLLSIPIGILITEIFIFLANIGIVFVLIRELELKFSFSISVFKEYLQTSPALFLATSGNLLSQESEPLIITLCIGPEVTTAYMVMRKAADILSQMLSVIIGSVHSAFSNLVSLNFERAKTIATKVITLIFTVGLITYATYIATNSAFIELWVGTFFEYNQTVISLIGVSFFFRSGRDILWQLLNGLGDFLYSSKVILFAGISRIVLMLTLIETIGLAGVPLALLISSLFSINFLSKRLKKHFFWASYKYSYLFAILSSIIVLFSSAILLESVRGEVDSWIMFLGGLICTLLVMLLLFIMINWNQRKWFNDFIRA